MYSIGGRVVLERKQMLNMLKEQCFQQTGCTSNECAIEAGQLIGVSHIIAGSIGKVGRTYLVTARLIDVSKLYASNYNIDVMNVQADSANYSFTTTWALGPTFSTISGFLPNSMVLLEYHMPCRNDSTSWGGMYIEPQVSFNGGTYESLGSSGFDAVMHNGSADIASYYNSILINPNISTEFTTQFRFYFRSYDGTSLLNQSHNINTVSGTASIMSGVNGTQHYAKIIVWGISPS